MQITIATTKITIDLILQKLESYRSTFLIHRLLACWTILFDLHPSTSIAVTNEFMYHMFHDTVCTQRPRLFFFQTSVKILERDSFFVPFVILLYFVARLSFQDFHYGYHMNLSNFRGSGPSLPSCKTDVACVPARRYDMVEVFIFTVNNSHPNNNARGEGRQKYHDNL